MNIFSMISFCKKSLAQTIDKQLINEYAWLIVTTVFDKTKTELIANPPHISSENINKIQEILFAITKNHKPIQYILKAIPFLNLQLDLEPPILICRPETEQLCEHIIQMLQPYKNEKLLFLDIGTGSGCIALSLAQAFPNATVYAVDISEIALNLARRNAEKNNITNVVFVQSDLFSMIDQSILFDLIISNPPYIAKEEWNLLESSVKEWEDFGALVANDDGFSILSSIIKQTKSHLNTTSILTKNHQAQLVLEIGHTQGKKIQTMMQEESFSSVAIWQDQYGKDRAVFGIL